MTCRRWFVAVALCVAVSPSFAVAASKGARSGASHATHVKGSPKKDASPAKAPDRRPRETHATTARATPVVPRDADGRLHRSAAAKHAFEAQSGYPHGRPGYVVDHKVPLACGGADAPGNMQWQTVGEAKAKDRLERRGCR